MSGWSSHKYEAFIVKMLSVMIQRSPWGVCGWMQRFVALLVKRNSLKLQRSVCRRRQGKEEEAEAAGEKTGKGNQLHLLEAVCSSH